MRCNLNAKCIRRIRNIVAHPSVCRHIWLAGYLGWVNWDNRRVDSLLHSPVDLADHTTTLD